MPVVAAFLLPLQSQTTWMGWVTNALRYLRVKGPPPPPIDPMTAAAVLALLLVVPQVNNKTLPGTIRISCSDYLPSRGLTVVSGHPNSA